jgi:hypothetical protein
MAVFVSVSLDENDAVVRDWFCRVVNQLGFEPRLGNVPRPGALPEKIKSLIDASDGFLAVLTKRDKIDRQELWKSPDWIQNEIGMAYHAGKQIAVVVEEGVDVSGVIKYVTTYVTFDRNRLLKTMPEIIALLLSLKAPQLLADMQTVAESNKASVKLAFEYVIALLQSVFKTKLWFRSFEGTFRAVSFVTLGGSVVLVLNAGTQDGIERHMIFEILTLEKHEGIPQPLETWLARVQIFHVQDRLSQAKILEANEENPTWQSMRTALFQETRADVPTNVARPLSSGPLDSYDADSLQGAIEIIRKTFTAMMPDIQGDHH